VTVEVSGAAGLAAGAGVDVLVSTESAAGGGRTSVALAGAELLRLEPAGGAGAYGGPGAEAGNADAAAGGTGAAPAGGTGAAGPTTLATLRVTLRQAVYLTAADNFAREIRLLARPPGDRSTAGAAAFHSY
jgi:pilus assembly protein CpaB